MERGVRSTTVRLCRGVTRVSMLTTPHRHHNASPRGRVGRFDSESAYVEGVRAIARFAGRLQVADWERSTPCDGWNVLDVVKHLRSTASDAHLALDDAIGNRPSHVLDVDELARHNTQMMGRLPEARGTVHLQAFLHLAT